MFKKKKVETITFSKEMVIRSVECPHCGKLLLNGSTEDIETLIEWKNQE